jgi:hypothetical protein
MTAQTEQRVRHRRKVTKRRALIAGLSALGVTGAAVVTTTSLLSTAGAAASWPTENGSKPVSKTIPVSGTYDGRMAKFYGTGDLGGSGQEEGQDPIFELADGAVLKNVIIGTPAADGVHCKGSCTLQNVWWPDVGEDAATFKGKSSSAVYTVYGGGAKNADDKVLQFKQGPYPRRQRQEDQDLHPLRGQQQRQGTEGTRHGPRRNLVQVLVI